MDQTRSLLPDPVLAASPSVTERIYAGPGRRFAAFTIDMALLLAVLYPIHQVFTFTESAPYTTVGLTEG